MLAHQENLLCKGTKKSPNIQAFIRENLCFFHSKNTLHFSVFNQLTFVGHGGQGDRGTAFFCLYTPFFTLTLCYSFIYEKQFLSLLIFFISKSNDVLIYTPYTIKRGRGDKKSLSPCPPVPFMRRKFSLSYFSSKQMIALDNVNNSFRYYKP